MSVLFADLVGFTALAEDRDPEEVRELLSRYFDTAREIVGRYGGTVEKFIGDAVMAVWGAPTAHEDDAERAVRAGPELTEVVPKLAPGAADLRLRAAVNTGEAAVTVGAIGEGMVAGDLVNTASRLQAVAPPGGVLVGEATYRTTNRAIAFEEAGDQTLKGKDLPVRAWRALHVVAVVGGAGRTERVEPPFVGRDAELRLLKDSFHATAREKRARLVSVIGPAGIGKSRLAWELEKYIDGLVEPVYWHRGRSPAYGEGVTFWALGEMVRERAGIAEGEDPRSTRSKLSATLADYVADQDDRRWMEPRLAVLLGIEESVPGEREELYAAWRALFEGVAARRPVVLVFEEFHWADAGLIEFVASILEWSRTHPILIVNAGSPGAAGEATHMGRRRPDLYGDSLGPSSRRAGGRAARRAGARSARGGPSAHPGPGGGRAAVRRRDGADAGGSRSTRPDRWRLPAGRRSLAFSMYRARCTR